MVLTEAKKLEVVDKVIEYVLKRIDEEPTEDLIQDIAVLALEKYPTFDENKCDEYMRLMHTKVYVLRTLNLKKERDLNLNCIPLSEEEIMDMINNSAIREYNTRYLRYMISDILASKTTLREAACIKYHLNGYTSEEVGKAYNLCRGYASSIIRTTIPKLRRRVFKRQNYIDMDILDEFLI